MDHFVRDVHVKTGQFLCEPEEAWRGSWDSLNESIRSLDTNPGAQETVDESSFSLPWPHTRSFSYVIHICSSIKEHFIKERSTRVRPFPKVKQDDGGYTYRLMGSSGRIGGFGFFHHSSALLSLCYFQVYMSSKKSRWQVPSVFLHCFSMPMSGLIVCFRPRNVSFN